MPKVSLPNLHAIYPVSANDILAGASFGPQDLAQRVDTQAIFTTHNATKDALQRMLSAPTDPVRNQPESGFGYQNKQQIFMPGVVVTARVEAPQELAQAINNELNPTLTVGPSGQGGAVTNRSSWTGLGMHTQNSLFGCDTLDYSIKIGADLLHPAETVYDAKEACEILKTRQADLERVVECSARGNDAEKAALKLDTVEGRQAVVFAFSPNGYVQQPPAYNPADRYGHQFFSYMAENGSPALVAQMPEMYKDYSAKLHEYQEKYPDMLPATQAARAMRAAVIMHSPNDTNSLDASVMKTLEDQVTLHMSMAPNITKMAREYCENAGINPQSEMGRYFTRELAMSAFTQGGTAAEVALHAVEKVGRDGYDVAAAEDFKALYTYAQEALEVERTEDATRLYAENENMDEVNFE